MSDGIELELDSGETVRPVFETDDGERLFANRVWVDEETAAYGPNADDIHFTVSFEVED